MPSLILKRGKRRYRGNVSMEELAAQKLFPDDSERSLKLAVRWEERKRAEFLKLLNRTDTGYLTLEAWIDQYLDDVREGCSIATYKEKQSVFRRFVAYLQFDELMPVEDITKAMAKRYLKAQNKARSGYAANKDRKNLAAAWVWGEEEFDDEWPEARNPFRAVKKFPEKRHPRYVPPEDDFWKVYNSVDGQDKVILLTFLHLGARKGEVFRLRFSDLDFANAQARLWTRKRKNGDLEHEWIPITTELIAALKWWVKVRTGLPRTDPDHVFVCLSPLEANIKDYGNPFTHRRRFMHSICKTAGVKYFDYHAMRHLSASVLHKAGYPVQHIQAVLRHKSITTTEKYLRRLGLEIVRKTLEDGLKLPAKVISFKSKSENKEATTEQKKSQEVAAS